jgi:hypothetical protein
MLGVGASCGAFRRPPEPFDGVLRDLPRSWLGTEDEAGVEPLIERRYRRRTAARRRSAARTCRSSIPK